MNVNNQYNPIEYVYDLSYDIFLCKCCESNPCRKNQRRPMKPENQSSIVKRLMNKVYATSYADSEQDMIEELNHIKISQEPATPMNVCVNKTVHIRK